MRNTLKTTALLAAAVLALVGQSHAEIRVVDVKGREVVLDAPAKRVVLNFYYEDFIAVVGPGAMDKVAALSLSTWKDWRPNQFEAYAKAIPALPTIPDIGDTENGTFSVEKVIATRPDLVILSAWAFDSRGLRRPDHRGGHTGCHARLQFADGRETRPVDPCPRPGDGQRRARGKARKAVRRRDE